MIAALRKKHVRFLLKTDVLNAIALLTLSRIVQDYEDILEIKRTAIY